MLLSKLSMGFQHPGFAIGNHWIAKPRNIYLVPGFAEYYVAFQYLVFKSSSKAPLRSVFLNSLLNLTPYPRNSSDLSPMEFGYFQLGIEHAFDESSVFVNFERLTYKFQFFHHFKL